MSAACRSAEETVSALTLQLAQAEANASAAVLKQQQAQASAAGCGIPEPHLVYTFTPHSSCSCAQGFFKALPIEKFWALGVGIYFVRAAWSICPSGGVLHVYIFVYRRFLERGSSSMPLSSPPTGVKCTKQHAAKRTRCLGQ